jgi:Uma2 family endonuclease
VTAAPRIQYTYAEYLAFERSTDVKHEYVNGLILAMAGGKPEHGARAVRAIVALGGQLRGKPCVVYDSDVRVRIRAAKLAVYPDVSVVCGRSETDPEDSDAIVNPVLVVEVLSPSTEQYDRGEKLDAYKTLPSLREVVLVAHDARRIDVWRRTADAWTLTTYGEGGIVPLESLGVSLEVDDVYLDPLAGVSA